MADSFRILIGRHIVNGQGANYESSYPTWAEARDQLFNMILGEDGDCPHCEAQSRAALAALDALPEGQSFAADVDGCDYLILPLSTPIELPEVAL